MASTGDSSLRDEAVHHAFLLEQIDDQDISYALAQRDYRGQNQRDSIASALSPPLTTASVRPLLSQSKAQPRAKRGLEGAAVGNAYDDLDEDEFRLDIEGHDVDTACMYA